MKLYILVIFSFLAFISIIDLSVFYHIRTIIPEPPVIICDNYKSKSKFACFLNKIVRKKSPIKLKQEYCLDIPHEIAIWIHFSFFIISIIVCIIDIALEFRISVFLGNAIIIISIAVLGIPLLYHFVFLILWEYTSFMQEKNKKE